MAYTKTDWIARQGTNLNKFNKSAETATSVILANAPDAVSVPGTPFSAANMNKMEQGIFDANKAADALFAAANGNQVIMFDSAGKPSVMVRVPKFNLEDIHPDLGTGPHPAFVVNGVVKDEIYIGAYQAIVENNLAYSLPGKSPKANITFDNAKAACVNKGAGWHLMTAWEWAAIVLWCMKNGFQPRGNTNSGKSYEAPWETGTPAPDNPSMILTGSGPASWRHDGTFAGIADLVGNEHKWNDGFKIVDGQVFAPDDNDYGLAESAWPATGVFFDASAGPDDRNGTEYIGEPILSNAVSKYSETPTPSGGGDMGNFARTTKNPWSSMAVSAGFDGLPDATKKKMAQLLIAPRLASGGNPLFSDWKGAIDVRNYGERFMLRGSNYGGMGIAGLMTTYLTYGRGVGSIGFYTAFIQ